MTSIKLSKVAFRLPDRELFSDINMTLGSGRQGLVGINGVGKSTLARLIAGDLEPSEGKILRSADVIYFGMGASVVSSGETTNSVLARVKGIEEKLGRAKQAVLLDWTNWISRVPIRDDIKELSGGESVRLRLLETLADAAELESRGRAVLIILDEPTNDLDHAGRSLVHEWVRARPSGLLLISHDREILEEVDEIFELSGRGLKLFGGGYTDFARAMTGERARAIAEVERLERKLSIKMLEKSEKQDRQAKRMRRGKSEAARGGMPRILIGARKRRAQVTQGKIESEESQRVQNTALARIEALREKAIDPFIRLDFKGEARPASEFFFTAEKLQLKGGPGWSEPLTFQIRARDRVWVRGVNGSGKSSLLQLLMGRGREFNGELKLAARLREPGVLGFLDQNQSDLRPQDSVLEMILESTRLDVASLRNALAFYGFTKASVHTKVATLSGGERLRLALARIFLNKNPPSFLILDEPTNSLDFTSVALLERAVRSFEGGVIIVTHDEVFAKSLASFRRMNL